jgi:hypothetical protein
MSVLAVLNQSKKIVGPAQVYLAQYPTGNCSGGTCTLTAGSPGLMTLVTPPTSGAVSIGATLNATGVTGPTTIASLASGVLNAPGSTYTLAGGSTILESTAEGFSCSGNPGYQGGTDALKITALKSLFFSDAATDADRVLIPNAWADLDATGVEINMKSNPVEFDPNNGSKYTMAYGPAACDVSWTFHDVDANHMIDMWSALSGDTFTTAPGASIGGRTTVLLGRQSAPLQVAIMIRYPSGVISPGGVNEYDYIIVPNATINPELKLKVDKKNAATAKVNPHAINEQSLQGTQPLAPFALISQNTAAATS